MVCTRCGEVIYTYAIEQNACKYGSIIYACPKCGKPYKFSIQIVVTELSVDTQLTEDDWGHKIVNDVTFSKKDLHN